MPTVVASECFQFSTKPQEGMTGLYYYGYRFFNPKGGRWISRDPIGERGGTNLYAFVGNDGVNGVDMLGLVIYVLDTTGLVKDIKPEDYEEFENDLDQLARVSEYNFEQLVKGGKIRINGKVYNGTKAEFIRKATRELSSMLVQAPSTANMRDIESMLQQMEGLATEEWDQVAFVAHGLSDGVEPLDQIHLPAGIVGEEDMECALASLIFPVTWVSCFRDGAKVEAGQMIPPFFTFGSRTIPDNYGGSAKFCTEVNLFTALFRRLQALKDDVNASRSSDAIGMRQVEPERKPRVRSNK